MGVKILCRILVRFGPLTPKFTLLKKTTFATIWQKSAYISEYRRSTITYFTGLIGIWVGIIIPILVWQSPKGSCYGNELN